MIFAALESAFFERQARDKINPIRVGDLENGWVKVAG
jgi:hypothetical protein